MNFKKLMVSGIAVGAITISSINLSYADTKLNVLNNDENNDSTVAVNQIEDNSILNIATDEEVINKVLEDKNGEETTISTVASKTASAVKTVSTEDVDAGVADFKNSIKSISSAVVSTSTKRATATVTSDPTVAVKETEATTAATEAATEATKQIEQATTTTQETKTYTKWTSSSVNVRQGSSTSSASLGVIAKGTKLTGTIENGWLKVDYNGKTGYVYSSNLSDSEVKVETVKPTEGSSNNSSSNQGGSSNQSNNDKDFSYSKVITVKATAYSMNESGLSHLTASGIDLRQNPNVIAVDRSVIPLGTKVYVEGYGYAIAGDTGGAIKGNKIDVHFNSVDKCYQWGVKNNVKVYILK